MKLKISSVADKGLLEKERIVLKAVTALDVGNFLLLQTGFNDKEVTISMHHAYWFPYKQISAGDLVVIYTKTGTDSEKSISNGHTAHFFYWGLSSAIWKSTVRAPVLLHASEWESRSPQEL
jgi:hypothetical protein